MINKLKRTLLIIISLLFINCNENSFYPETREESLNQGLLINDYKFEKKITLLNNEKFKIIEAWTTYKFKNNKKKEILNSFFAFRFRMINLKTLDTIPDFNIVKYIKIDTIGSKFGGLGVVDSQFTILYDSSYKNKLDTLKLDFITNNGKTVSFQFFKK